MLVSDGSMRRHPVAHLEKLALRVARRLVKGNGLAGLGVSNGSFGHQISSVGAAHYSEPLVCVEGDMVYRIGAFANTIQFVANYD